MEWVIHIYDKSPKFKKKYYHPFMTLKVFTFWQVYWLDADIETFIVT